MDIFCYKGWSLTVTSDGLIKRHEQILVPNDDTLRTTIISSHHDDPTAAHRGALKTIELVSRRFYWKNMHKDIKEYVSTCIKCQQNKSSNQQPLGLLSPIPTPEQRWNTVTMDLITQLPKTKSGHDAIVVFVDKFSKMVHYVPTVTTIDAPGLAELMISNVVRLHGIPINIISDRDPRFTSSFWKATWKQLGTRLKMSTAYHPQSDGLTERNNRSLEEALRAYVNYHQDNWDHWLALLEYAYNNSVNSTTGYTPFFLNYGQHPVSPLDYALVSKETQVNHTAATLLENLYTALDKAHENISHAQQQQKKYADQHRRDIDTQLLKVGDEVLLSTENLRLPGRAPKLVAKRIGPFKITKILSELVYELDLPPTLKGIHNRFHIQQLSYYRSTNRFNTRPTTHHRPPAIVTSDGTEDVYEVQNVLKHKKVGGALYYLIHWKGYPHYESTWEPESSFIDHRTAIDEYHRRLSTQKPSKRSAQQSSNGHPSNCKSIQ